MKIGSFFRSIVAAVSTTVIQSAGSTQAGGIIASFITKTDANPSFAKMKVGALQEAKGPTAEMVAG